MITQTDASKIIADHLRQILIDCKCKSNEEAELILALVIKNTNRALRVAVGDEIAERTIALANSAAKQHSESDSPYSEVNLKKRGLTILNPPETIQ